MDPAQSEGGAACLSQMQKPLLEPAPTATKELIQPDRSLRALWQTGRQRHRRGEGYLILLGVRC